MCRAVDLDDVLRVARAQYKHGSIRAQGSSHIPIPDSDAKRQPQDCDTCKVDHC
jgi:hypothetical protein